MWPEMAAFSQQPAVLGKPKHYQITSLKVSARACVVFAASVVLGRPRFYLSVVLVFLWLRICVTCTL